MSRISRRKLFQGAAAAAAAVPSAAQVRNPQGVNLNSAPSNLKITDMRACTIAANYDYPIIRIDTNQGVYGLGEVRDAGVKGIALILKAHILGKNPLEIDSVLGEPAPVRRAGPHGRRLQRRGHGAARYRRQSLRRAGVAPGGAEVPRPHPHVLRYHRPQRPQDLRRAHARSGRRWGSRFSRWTSTRAW